MSIHPSAIISDKAKLGKDVVVGPYVVIRGETVIGDGVIIDSFATVGSDYSYTEIGAGSRLYPGAVIGETPQDLKYKGERTSCILGKENMIREYVTIHAGTPTGGGITKMGDRCLIMAYSHVAHDCQLGTDVIIANATQLAGHVEIEDHVKIGGGCLLNQFIRLGTHSYIAGDSSINKDILPFAIAQGKYAVMRAANQIGMDRSGYDKAEIEHVKRALRIITKGGLRVEEALARVEQECESFPSVKHLLDFARKSERGIAI
ncbi:MAG: acyl-ACP--UDP-N-acetylglucosamine O-acyltransferase [Bdellovibrionales bacterium]|nr:acyl-ACP--UDP-N-acetylglucosamine O-acyltransferase [Bdellovibrionales bacterium]